MHPRHTPAVAMAACGHNDLQATVERNQAIGFEVVNPHQGRADLAPKLVNAFQGEADFERTMLARWLLLVLGLPACGLVVAQGPMPEVIEAHAPGLAEPWKPGRRTVDDAALLVVARNDRTARIEMGCGLEGARTDATTRRFIGEAFVPRLAQQDDAGGIVAAAEQTMRVIDGERLSAAAVDESYPVMSLPALIGAALVLGGVLRRVMGRPAGSAATGALIGITAWWLEGGLSMAVLAGFVALLVSLMGGLGYLPFGGSASDGGRLSESSGGGLQGGCGLGGGASGRW